ncbi:MAG TPA: hypothetical protein VMV69_03030 [Pirellulales bacterium]|nr:hypothetical protein [Pirellulales bacterium]
MSILADVQARNRELARQINEEARRNPHSPYAGKFAGIANGQIVVVADDLEEMARRLEKIEPAGFDGVACFGFLNRFTYGNFGDPHQFGLEA